MSTKQERHNAGVLQRLVARDLRTHCLDDVAKAVKAASGTCARNSANGPEVLRLTCASEADHALLDMHRTIVSEAIANVLHPGKGMISLRLQGPEAT